MFDLRHHALPGLAITGRIITVSLEWNIYVVPWTGLRAITSNVIGPTGDRGVGNFQVGSQQLGDPSLRLVGEVLFRDAGDDDVTLPPPRSNPAHRDRQKQHDGNHRSHANGNSSVTQIGRFNSHHHLHLPPLNLNSGVYRFAIWKHILFTHSLLPSVSTPQVGIGAMGCSVARKESLTRNFLQH